MTAPTYESLTDELGWGRCYFVQGSMSPGYRVNELTSPPVTGWSHVIVRDSEKHCTLFCPYTFTSMTVSHKSMEYSLLRSPVQPFKLSSFKDQMLTKWAMLEDLSIGGDFGMASHIMKALDLEPPTIKIMAMGVDDFGDPIEVLKARKGKQLEEELKKPVKRESKRGKLLSWFLAEGGGPKSLAVCMDVFKITRSNALSYLFMLNKDHGIGYVLGGNTATVTVPGNINPFKD